MAIPFLSDAKFSRLHKLKFHSTGEITTTGASGTNFDISAIGSNTDLRFLADNDDGNSSVYFLLDASMADYTTPDYYTRFPDNSHLVFGDSANTTALDFEIYHEGTAAYLQGDSSIYIASENLIQLNANNGVELRHNNSRKIHTTTTGVDVTGTINLDNLTINGAQGTDGQVLTSTGTGIAWEDASGGASLSGGEANKVAIWSATDTLTHNDNFHFDTTNVRLGIGTPSPSEKLEVSGGAIKVTNTGGAQLILRGDSNNSGDAGQIDGIIDFLHDTGVYGYRINTENYSGSNAFHIQDYKNSSYISRIYIDQDGEVGIGTTSPSQKLHVNGNVTAGKYYENGSTVYFLEPASTSNLHSLDVGLHSFDNNGNFDIGDTAGVNSGTSMHCDGTDITVEGGAGQTYFSVGGSGTTFGDSNINGVITLNGTGRIQGIDTVSASTDAASKGYVDSSIHNGTLTVQGTGALGGSGTFTANQSSNATISISHDDTSSQGSVNNSGNTVIQDVTLDTYGHVTGLASKTLSIPTVNNATLTVQGTGALGGSGTFTANQSSNATISISHDDTSSQSSVNNSSGTVIQDVTLDTYGHVTSLGSVNLDGRYYTESEMQTFFKRGFIGSHTASNLAVGWYTIATNTGDRALGEFQIWEMAGGRHQSVLFNASHHFGQDNSNDLTVLANSRFSTDVFRYIRIKENSTYDGAVLQVYIDNSTNSVAAAITGANAQVNGWVLQDWVPDATTPSSVSNYSSFTEKCRIDLDNTRDGGMETTGQFHAQNFIQSSYDSSKYARFESNSSGGVVKGVGGNGFLARSYGDTYFNGGDFGIGVTDPNAKIHVDHGTTRAASLTFGAAAGQIFQNENSEFAFGLHNASPYPLWIQGRTTSNTSRAIALNPLGGQVNIGTLSQSTSSYRLNMGGSIDMNAYNIDYVSQLHFNDNVRFYDDGNDSYLNFKWGDSGAGGMRFRDGQGSLMGTVYGDGGDQFGLLDADGSWAVRIDKDVAVDLRVNNSSRIICDTGGTEFRNGGTIVGEVTTAGLARFANDVVAYNSFSDQRLKTNIKATTNNLDKILKLEPVEYTWKDGARQGKKEIGLIAQDVENIVPEVVRENKRLNDDTLYKQVDYEHLVSTLIGAVQEQQKQINELKSIINGGS